MYAIYQPLMMTQQVAPQEFYFPDPVFKNILEYLKPRTYKKIKAGDVLVRDGLPPTGREWFVSTTFKPVTILRMTPKRHAVIQYLMYDVGRTRVIGMCQERRKVRFDEERGCEYILIRFGRQRYQLPSS